MSRSGISSPGEFLVELAIDALWRLAILVPLISVITYLLTYLRNRPTVPSLCLFKLSDVSH